MKKYLLVLISVLSFNCMYSQVLYTENFDNHSVGYLGTNTTGTIPGQWGWFTYSQNTQSNSFFTIVNETGRGKVLDISTGLTSNEAFDVFKTNLSPLINNRNAGNEVLMFEIDYYTGSKHATNTAGNFSRIAITGIDGNVLTAPTATNLAGFVFHKTSGGLILHPSVGVNGANFTSLPFNTWVKFVFYLDYTNRKVYFEISNINKVFVTDFLKNETSTNLIQDFPPNSILLSAGVWSGINEPQIYTRNRYDNIKITALNVVPPEVVNLSVTEQLAAKFNLYPNPATNVVNISNSENMVVQQVTIYDIAGKQLSTQSFNNDAEIQLNVENLASGTYLLYLQTKEGIAVKKLVKK